MKITAAQLRLQYLFDYVPTSKIMFDDFTPEENGLVSSLIYNNQGIGAICNKKYATATARRDDGTLRFSDKIDGHCSAIHGMLRVMFNTIPPIDIILGHAHNMFTTILYSLIIRIFNRDYSLITFPEQQLAAIRYACACISGYKHFEMNEAVNMCAVPITTMIFNRVNPNYYLSIHNPINSYDAFVSYLEDRCGITGIDKSTVINAILRQLGYRALITLECGADMMIDILLSKSVNHIISSNLYKIIGIKNYDNIQSKISQLYNKQANSNIQM